MKVQLIFKWFDFWVGLFWDQDKKNLYIFPIPMFGIKIEFSKTCKNCRSQSSCIDKKSCSIRNYKKGLIEKPWWVNNKF